MSEGSSERAVARSWDLLDQKREGESPYKMGQQRKKKMSCGTVYTLFQE